MKNCGGKRVRVLVVEDSDTERRLIEHIIDTDPRLTVIGAARSGEVALDMLNRLSPDVVSMDVRLPGIDGIETTKRIMRRRPTPIVVVASGAAKESRLYFEALRAGALSIVEKPAGTSNVDFAPIAARLCRQLQSMSEVRLVRRRGFKLETADPRPPSASAPTLSHVRAVGLVASTGGPVALSEVIGDIDADFPAPIFVVQHIGPTFCEGFVEWLNALSPLPVALAAHGDQPQPGHVYVAPSGMHLEVGRDRMLLVERPPVSRQCPSGSVLFDSLAREHGAACIGVLLTGMGDDGAAGLKAIREAGGHTIVEDESTAVVFGMPGAARALDAAVETLALPRIAPRLCQIAALKPSAAS